MSKHLPLLVGITGGIGAGKSTVARIFSLLAVPIYYADERAKWLMANNEALKIKIIEAFGDQSFQDNKLNRQFLAEKVFSDADNTKTINDLVHPAVRNDFLEWSEQQKVPYVIKEAALLFETGSYKELDKTINVSAPLKVRVSRILMRDPHRRTAQIDEIINRQLPDNEKNKLADFVIKNTEKQMILPQVLTIHEQLVSASEI